MLPSHSWSVVRTTGDGAFSHVIVVDGDVVLDDSRGEFEVGVCDGAMWVVERHEALHNVWWETRAPEDGNFVAPRWCKQRAVVMDERLVASARGRGRNGDLHSAHAYAAGVWGSEEFGVWLRDNLLEPG